ncbi:MAG: VCBS repeat-containing protein, partial [Crocosphaera sp.]
MNFRRTDFSVGDTPLSIASGNFNDDINLDLVVVNLESDNISVLLGDGTGDFSDRTDITVGEAP